MRVPRPLLRPVEGETGSNRTVDNPQARVAILDDDPSVRTAIARLLRASEMSVQCFDTFLDLLSSLDTYVPDCLVLDLQMPGVNGIEVLRYLSARKIELPVVMITAYDAAGTRSSCLQAGASSYVPKPIDATTLIKAIDDAINTGKTRH